MPSFSSLVLPSLYHATRQTVPRAAFAARSPASPFSTFAANAMPHNKPEIVTFEELDERIHKAEKNYVLIDVREPGEVAQGVIPTSHHIPVGNLQEALTLEPKEFEARFGFKKFDKDDEVIFYCRSGRRSGIAFETAKSLGYNGVRNYAGSWIDYESKISKQ
ncbi:hypothetical protein BGW42_007603 [Actinomortierella wolfii]|nr:hypothetical protein BGW42_007603 [Actinomortierella wolfii]